MDGRFVCFAGKHKGSFKADQLHGPRVFRRRLHHRRGTRGYSELWY